ncbi:MAG: DUF255 domain-containing protein [Nitrospirales bacterium]|nr:DUF255 domain-containing protein [Nitrospirales bacterium]
MIIRTWMMLWGVLFFVALPCSDAHELPDSLDQIHWYEWGGQAFQKSQIEEKLILLDLTAVWCHACHVMDETTYADPAVAAILNTSFVPIRVDTDQYPDLEARYRSGGWPTTSLLLPTGEILFQANALTPNEMKELLNEAKALYAQEKVDLQRQANQLWEKVHQAAQATAHDHELSPALVEQSVTFMKSQFDPEYGGFRSAPKFFEPDAIHLALALGYLNRDERLTHMALHTLDRQTALLDSVWGGFYRYAEQADWTDPHYEKMLTVQSGNLKNYLEAFQRTGRPMYAKTAQKIVEYVGDFLTDHTNGHFWESQDADLRDKSGALLVPGSAFFSLDEEKRGQYGQPAIDRRVFTGSNAGMIEAFLEASWVLDRPELRELALRVLETLDEEWWDGESGLRHVLGTEHAGVSSLLSDHRHVGQALVAAFQSTGDQAFLQRAEHLAAQTQALLEDAQEGGFYDRPGSRGTLGLLKMPIKPAQENLHMALWYLDLYQLTQKPEYRVTAERTIRSVLSAKQPIPIALMGKTADLWFRGKIHVAVVGEPNDPLTRALVLEGHRVYYPGKLVRVFNPALKNPQWGEIVFPYPGHPVAFACTDRVCSPPVRYPENLAANILDVVGYE